MSVVYRPATRGLLHEHPYFLEKSLLCRFLVMDGRRTTSPSKSLLICIWQPNLDLRAKSAPSSQSSSGEN